MRHLDSELYLPNASHARFRCDGRDYEARDLRLDDTLITRLHELGYEPQVYGATLFDAAVPPGSPLRDGLRAALARAEESQLRLRLRLHLAPGLPTELHRVHWELLFDPDRKVALARSPDTAFSRFGSTPHAPRGPVSGRPRLLGVVAAPTDAARFQMAPIDDDDARQRLLAAFASLPDSVDFELLDGPATPERLRDRLSTKDYHGLHIFGHGMAQFRRRAGLMMQRDDGRARVVDETLLSEIFLGERDLRLVTLVACHGGALSSNDTSSGLAARLVERGVPAVVGMAQAVTFDQGHRFTDHLYRNLSRTGTVDVATNEARHQLFLAEPDGMAWSSPILHMRLADGRLWGSEPTVISGTPVEPVPPVAVPPPGMSPAAPWGWARQATTALVALVLTLALWPAPNADANLDLVVSRVGFTVANSQSVIERLSLRELAVSDLAEVVLPTDAPNPTVHRETRPHALGLVVRIDAERDPGASLDLQLPPLDAGTHLALAHESAHRYRLSLDVSPAQPALPQLSAALAGPAWLRLLHQRPSLVGAGPTHTVRWRARGQTVAHDLELAVNGTTDLVPVFDVTGLDLLTLDRSEAADRTTVRGISTIQSGRLTLTTSQLGRALKPQETLRFDHMAGTIYRFDPKVDGVALGVRGRFHNLRLQLPGGTIHRPTVLGLWTKPGLTRNLLVVAVLLLSTTFFVHLVRSLAPRLRMQRAALNPQRS